FEVGEALAHEAFELGSAAGVPGTPWVLRSQLFWIRYDQGRMAELLEVVTRRANREESRSITRALLCVILCELDRPDEARPVFQSLAAQDFAAVSYPWFQTITVLAKVCPLLGE